jgi:hypothetical protein
MEPKLLLEDEEECGKDLNDIAKEGKDRPVPEKLRLIGPRQVVPVYITL